MLDGAATSDITLTRSAHQGFPLRLLFTIITHPLLVRLSRLVTNGDILGLHLLSGGQLVAHALANDSFMFLQASRENLEKGMLVWNQFALASGGSLVSYHALKGIRNV